MYHPLLIHEGITGCVLGTFLRPGNASASENGRAALAPILTRLKAAFAHALILLRADAGLAGPRLYQFCPAHGIGFTMPSRPMRLSSATPRAWYTKLCSSIKLPPRRPSCMLNSPTRPRAGSSRCAC